MNRRGGRYGLAALALVAFVPAMPVFAAQTVASPKTDTGTAGEKPRDYLEFSEALNADCMLHRARLRQIANTHPSRAIRVVLVSYTGKTRSQGDSEITLAPESDPRPLGCDANSGLDRRWEIVNSTFVEPKSGSNPAR